VDHSAVQDWVTGPGETKSGITVKRAFGVLSAILEECVRERGILANPCAGIKAKRKVSREHVYMTHHDVQKLAREATGHELLVLVLASTELRWGEMAGLRVSDVDHLRRRLNVNQNAVEVGAEIIVRPRRTTPDARCRSPRCCRSGCCPNAPTSCPPRCFSPGPDGECLRRTRTDGKSSVRRRRAPRWPAAGDSSPASAHGGLAGGDPVWGERKVIQRMLGQVGRDEVGHLRGSLRRRSGLGGGRDEPGSDAIHHVITRLLAGSCAQDVPGEPLERSKTPEFTPIWA
jgi:hypothetical protein